MASFNLIVMLHAVLLLANCFKFAEGSTCDISGTGSNPDGCGDAMEDLVDSIEEDQDNGVAALTLCNRLLDEVPSTLQACKLDVPNIEDESEKMILQLREVYGLYISLSCDTLFSSPRPGCAMHIDCFEGTASEPGIFDINNSNIVCGTGNANYLRTKECLEDRLPTVSPSCDHLCKNVRALVEAEDKLC